MNESDLPEAIRRARDEITVRPAPVEALVRNGRHAQQRRRLAVLAGVLSAVGLVVVGGLLIRPNVSAAPDVAKEPDGTPVAIATSDWKPGDDSLQALIGGTLQVNKEGCIFLPVERDRSDDIPGTAVDVVWPAGYTAERLADGTVVVKRPDGEVVAATGHEFRSGGGATTNPEGIDFPCLAGKGGVWFVHDELPPLDETARVEPTPALTAADLTGNWAATMRFGRDVDEGGARQVLTFSPAQEWSGTDGCNAASGKYTVETDGSFEASLTWKTLMGCTGHDERFSDVGVLTAAEYVSLEDDVLTFIAGDGETIGEYRPPAAGEVTIPKVVGLPLQEAEQVLGHLGLDPSVKYYSTDGVPPGVVVEQRPPVGKELKEGSRATLIVAFAPSAIVERGLALLANGGADGIKQIEEKAGKAYLTGIWGEHLLSAVVAPKGAVLPQGEITNVAEVGGERVMTVELPTEPTPHLRFTYGDLTVDLQVLSKDGRRYLSRETLSLASTILCPSECGKFPDGADG